MKDITFSRAQNGRKFRGLDVLGKDMELLNAISDPKFNADAITNKLLQEKLLGTKWTKGMTDKRLSFRISRYLSLLRDHGLIRKLPNQHKYALTAKGKKITTAMGVALASSTEDLMKLTG
jgi:predicted transcriptional regulator